MNIRALFKKILIIFFTFFFASICYASFDNGTISSNFWKAKEVSNNTLLNAGYFTQPGIDTYNVHVTDSGLSGLMFGESAGWIRLNCAAVGNLPNGCTDSNYRVSLDANTDRNYGILSGFAWGQNTGWVSFNCLNSTPLHPAGSCADANFSVRINSAGEFTGYAWSENYGYIKFDCADSNACVKTDWLPKVSRPVCADGLDNDADGLADNLDKDCHTDCNVNNSSSYNSSGVAESGLCGGGSPPPPPPSYCSTHPSDPICLIKKPTFCELNPNDPICKVKTFCELNPADPLCSVKKLTFCELNPTDPTCKVKTFCELNPTDPACKVKTFCELNPKDPTCVVQSFCYLNPSDPSCITKKPTFCELNPTDPTCNQEKKCDSIYCYIKDNVKKSVKDSGGVYKSAKIKVKKIFEDPNTSSATKVVGVVGATAGVISTLAGILFLNPVSLGEALIFPWRLWNLLVIFIGLKKKNRPWGTVYDSITKQPLDPVYVSVFDINGKEVETSITDLDGRFGFLLPSGTYTIVAHKTNYVFPSKILDGKVEDEIYKDLYYGKQFTVLSDNDLVISNIPMDPENFDWNEYAKRQQLLMKYHKTHEVFWVRFANVLYFLGYGVSLLSWYAKASTYNMVVVVFYTLMLILKYTALRPKPRSYVLSSKGNPYPYAIVRIMRNGKDFIKKITNKNGQFYCLIPNGTYEVSIEKKNLDGSYTSVLKRTVEVTNGYLNEKFIIE